jgi:hypothetical protein
VAGPDTHTHKGARHPNQTDAFFETNWRPLDCSCLRAPMVSAAGLTCTRTLFVRCMIRWHAQLSPKGRIVVDLLR